MARLISRIIVLIVLLTSLPATASLVLKQHAGAKPGALNSPGWSLAIDPALSWNTFLGGSGSDWGSGVAIDPDGNVYVIGTSEATWNIPMPEADGGQDAFVAKLDPEGTLLWCTFLGGPGQDRGNGIAVDPSGFVYATGWSSAKWGAPVRDYGGYDDAFAAKLDADGSLVWNTFLGGTDDDDLGRGIAVDSSGNSYVTGKSGPWGSPKRAFSDNNDAFVAKLDENGGLVWNTFLGGADSDEGTGIAVDADGRAYVIGSSEADWGSLVRPYGGGESEAFAAKLDTDGSLIWNTFLGGPDEDTGSGIALDASGNVYGAGTSDSNWGSPVLAYAGGSDGFVVKLNADNGALEWNAFLGGTDWDSASGIALDTNANVYVTGMSGSTWGSTVLAFAGGQDAFVAKLNAAGEVQWNAFLGGPDGGYGLNRDSGTGIAVYSNEQTGIYVLGESNETWGSPVRPHTDSDSEPFSVGDDAFVAKISEAGAPDNTAPIAQSQTVTTQENAALGIVLSATDEDGDPLTYIIVTNPAHGLLSGALPSLTYTPESGFFGSDSFTFRANDGSVDSNTATISIRVNAPPVAQDQAITTNEDTAVTVILGATDPEGDALTYSIVTQPAHGTLTGTAPDMTYAPASGFHGQDSFTFKANDGKADSSPATVTITINGQFVFYGFDRPIDNLPLVNSVQAGSAIPVGWRIMDSVGMPISDPKSFVSITSYLVDCGTLTGDPSGGTTEQSAGNSGLQYLGYGYWQFNWKTLKIYQGECRAMVLTLADGTTHSAFFRFR